MSYIIQTLSDRTGCDVDRILPNIDHRSECCLAAQERDLRAAGAERIFAEKASSASKRATLAECLLYLRDGDVLVVTKPDRLARNTAELLALEGDLSGRGVGLLVLSMGGAALDTRNPTSKLMLTILAGVATWEREIMLERQREGIAVAKAAGNYRGRPPCIKPEDIQVLAATMGPAAIAKKLGIARSSVYRLLGERPVGKPLPQART
jgi:DNA invertase Pin-like site-specific DNA recombinase